ncbi:MAG TPA: hypothetical protein VIX12_04315 [Candidatus Binataceae bacterium]
MRTKTLILSAALGAALMLAGCQHRLVAANEEHTVGLYPDEQTYMKIAQMKGQGGVAGMIGGMGQNLATRQIDNDTPVRIISSDDMGSQVEIIDGPLKGTTGFAPKQNVN